MLAIVLGRLYSFSGVFMILNFACLSLMLYHILLKNNRELRTKMLTVFGSMFFSYILFEIVLRIFGVGATYYEKRFGYFESVKTQNEITNYCKYKADSTHFLHSDEFNYIRNTNSLGLTDILPEKNRPENQKLLIALGDSFTEGDGTHKDSTWLKFLEYKYSTNDSIEFKFFNAGVCGSDPIYEFKLLKDELLFYNPDLVIVSYGYETTDIIIRGGKERFEKMEVAIHEHWWQPIYTNSFVFRLIIHRILGYNDLLILKSEYIDAERNALEILKESLLDFKLLSEEENFELLVVFIPNKYEIINADYKYNDILYEFSIDNNINSFDLLDYYLNIVGITESNYADYFWKEDGHHNAAGYEKYAEGVLWKLEQIGY
jgi:hypothetical protein